ncbi:MAG: hypothetical protein HY606_10210, partial [Planctomycetes bacterium]|nr:hypothetical protein [Planctomycetota bacterium]
MKLVLLLLVLFQARSSEDQDKDAINQLLEKFKKDYSAAKSGDEKIGILNDVWNKLLQLKGGLEHKNFLREFGDLLKKEKEYSILSGLLKIHAQYKFNKNASRQVEEFLKKFSKDVKKFHSPKTPTEEWPHCYGVFNEGLVAIQAIHNKDSFKFLLDYEDHYSNDVTVKAIDVLGTFRFKKVIDALIIWLGKAEAELESVKSGSEGDKDGKNPTGSMPKGGSGGGTGGGSIGGGMGGGSSGGGHGGGDGDKKDPLGDKNSPQAKVEMQKQKEAELTRIVNALHQALSKLLG